MKHSRTIILIIFVLCTCYSHSLEARYGKLIQHFINCIKKNKRKELAKLIRFPLRREYPIPSINNTKEFLLRFDEVFDKTLIRIIAQSNIKRDWEQVGCRGIILSHGTLWLDYDGTLLSINHQSQKEKKKRQEIIRAQKNFLHTSLKNFKEPVLHWETKKFRIRVDHIGNYRYRYAVWSVRKKANTKPDLILRNGKLTLDGSGGNHYYTFKNGSYRYECSVIVIGTAISPPGTLCIYKGKKLLLSQDVIKTK